MPPVLDRLLVGGVPKTQLLVIIIIVISTSSECRPKRRYICEKQNVHCIVNAYIYALVLVVKGQGHCDLTSMPFL